MMTRSGQTHRGPSSAITGSRPPINTKKKIKKQDIPEKAKKPENTKKCVTNYAMPSSSTSSSRPVFPNSNLPWSTPTTSPPNVSSAAYSTSAAHAHDAPTPQSPSLSLSLNTSSSSLLDFSPSSPFSPTAPDVNTFSFSFASSPPAVNTKPAVNTSPPSVNTTPPAVNTSPPAVITSASSSTPTTKCVKKPKKLLKKNLLVATWNVRTLNHDNKLEELAE